MSDFEHQNTVPTCAVADAEHVYVIENNAWLATREVVGKAEENLLIRAKILSGELIVARPLKI